LPPLTGQIIVTTINGMFYEWDETKRATNLAKHGLDFTLAEEFSWPSALIIPDARQDYGEARYFAIGELGGRLHVFDFHAARRPRPYYRLAQSQCERGKAL